MSYNVFHRCWLQPHHTTVALYYKKVNALSLELQLDSRLLLGITNQAFKILKTWNKRCDFVQTPS